MSDAVSNEVDSVPPVVRAELIHAYVQFVANRHGVRVLHLKGAAVHEALLSAPRISLDVDVLVHPDDVQLALEALKGLGWQRISGFEEGSAFGHAMNLHHDLGTIDLHRSWPGYGIDPVAAFDLLWPRRGVKEIAGVACDVPSLDDQRLVLLLHHARSGGARADDRQIAFIDADAATQQRVRKLACEFDAELALAASLDELEAYRGRSGYVLWRYFARGEGSRYEEWTGRFFAARGARAKVAVMQRFFMVNPDLLRFELGHEPSRDEIRHAYRERATTALKDAWKSMTGRQRRGDGS